MKHAFTAILSCLAILLGTAGNASGAATTFDAKNRVGVSDQNPDINTYAIGSLELEPQREDTILGYDPATGVVFYVRQNPWSKFDPKGLWEKEVATQIVRTVAQTTAQTAARVNLVSSVVSTGLVVAHIGVKMHEASQAPPGSFNQTKTCVNGISQGDSGSVDHFTMAQQISDPGKISVHTEEGSYESKDDGGWTQTSGQNIGTRGDPGSGGDPSGGAGPSGEGTPFVPNEAWTNNAPANVTPGTTRLDHTKLNETTGEFEQSLVTYDEFGRQNYRVDKTDHGRPRGNGDPNDTGHSNPHLHESSYAPSGTQGHNQDTGRKEVKQNIIDPDEKD